ncbi:MAG: hypothetical protein EOP04_16565, partial [Proteobacteria bacterium]
MFKKFLYSAVAFSAMSGSAFANCNDKCIARNPVNGNCMLEVRVCDLSMETVEGAIEGFGQVIEGGTKWLGGASMETLQE